LIMSLLDLLKAENRKKLVVGISAFCFVTLIALGAMAKNGWLPSTDPMTGEKTGWFGSKSSPPYEGGVDAFRGRGGSLDPNAPLPSGTPQLKSEYIYAGSSSRLLAIEDANTTATVPTDLAVWRPSTGEWYVVAGSGWTTATWGISTDKPVPGDYDGDGKTDFSVFRPSTYTWHIVYSSTGGSTSYAFGTTGDKPAPADYDGDGKTDAAVFRPSNFTWYIQGSSVGYYTVVWGDPADTPVSADYDGDGKADIAVWRTSNRKFYSINSSNQSQNTIDTSFNPSSPSWVAVSGDYDGDGKADYGVYDSNTANWYIRSSLSGTFPPSPVQWGASGDTAVHNDYDGDGKVDYAVSGHHQGQTSDGGISRTAVTNQPEIKSGAYNTTSLSRRFIVGRV
jgi:FG-GAP-like repeat